MNALGAAGCSLVAAWAGALSIVDLRDRRLPNRLTLPGAAALLAGAAACGRFVPAVFGALVLAGLYLVVHLVVPAGLGAGDVKLALGLGALTGAFGSDAWVLGAVGAPVLTALAAVVAVLAGRGGAVLPHGPSMCVASLGAVALVWF
jgi:leader peptidase (prepilin peptidase)/N-methyltransferase